MANTNENVNVVITKSPKSMGISIALTLFFGPLGMFYSTILGAIVMIIIDIIVGIFTFGLGLIVTWPIQVIWAAIATSMYNKKLMKGEFSYEFRVAQTHLSYEKAVEWVSRQMGPNSKCAFLHQHSNY